MEEQSDEAPEQDWKALCLTCPALGRDECGCVRACAAEIMRGMTGARPAGLRCAMSKPPKLFVSDCIASLVIALPPFPDAAADRGRILSSGSLPVRRSVRTGAKRTDRPVGLPAWGKYTLRADKAGPSPQKERKKEKSLILQGLFLVGSRSGT